MEAQAVIDLTTYNTLKELMGAEFVNELIDTFNQETGQLIESLRRSLHARDAAAFNRHAHSIKSSSASLGALGFSQQARELEMLGKAGDLNAAGPRLEQLAADFPLVIRGLEVLKNEP